MPSEAEIKATYKAQHDTLSESYYNGTSGLTKEQFDLQHGQTWDNMKAELIANGYLPAPQPPISFTPINPIMGVEHRLTHVENFLGQRYPP